MGLRDKMFKGEDGIGDYGKSRGIGDVYKKEFVFLRKKPASKLLRSIVGSEL